MKEADIITAAWSERMKEAYAVFAQNWVAANGDPVLQQAAEDSFRTAVKNAKQIKERALSIVLGA
ncbi:hypothetical protein V8J88_00090 [Massilia sp. W12]|uniref:hypothetical protein n=1 Tax=Massilia sp. W12 TaxID=3126507 RepID=UPI0030D13777